MRFPMFMDIENQSCVVVGGGDYAVKRVETLLPFGALIQVISPEFNIKFSELTEQTRLQLAKKEYHSQDLEGAFLVIAASDDRILNLKVSKDAHERNLLVNVVGSQSESTFAFPALVVRGEAIAGICTSGEFPLMSKYLREKLESVMQPGLGDAMTLLRKYRTIIQESGLPKEKKRMFDERAVETVIQMLDKHDILMHSHALMDDKLKRLYKEVAEQSSRRQ
jgi:siroheme synthase-like protein